MNVLIEVWMTALTMGSAFGLAKGVLLYAPEELSVIVALEESAL